MSQRIFPITMPKWGIEMQQGTITPWHAAPGQASPRATRCSTSRPRRSSTRSKRPSPARCVASWRIGRDRGRRCADRRVRRHRTSPRRISTLSSPTSSRPTRSSSRRRLRRAAAAPAPAPPPPARCRRWRRDAREPDCPTPGRGAWRGRLQDQGHRQQRPGFEGRRRGLCSLAAGSGRCRDLRAAAVRPLRRRAARR